MRFWWSKSALLAAGLLTCLLATPLLAQNVATGERKSAVSAELLQRYPALAAEITPENLNAHLRILTQHESRVVGYPGERAAAKYVESQFREIFAEVDKEEFFVTVPMDSGGKLVLPGQDPIAMRALWPNLVRTSQLPKEGLEAPLIYAGKGKLSEFNGRLVEGAAVVVEFNSASDWLNAPRMGAKAVIFVEPESTMRGEAESKFLAIPVAIPRFWISRGDAARLIPQLQRKDPPLARLFCDMTWERVPAYNFIGRIQGQGDPNDPGIEDQIIVLEAYYDAMSMVPSLAPGAEQALSMAALLELAKLYHKFPPKRTVWFVATSAHTLGLQGIKHYIERHIDDWSQPSLGEKFGAFLSNTGGTSWLVDIWRPLRYLVCLLLLGGLVFLLVQAFRRGAPGQGFAGAALLIPILVLLYTDVRTERRSPPEIYLFCGLDLSSHNKGVAMFYKGYYYDFREDIQNKFSDIARVTRENSEKVALTFGQNPKDIFNDGINPIEGKNWRNFFPGKMALDAEAWTLTGARGISFATTDDGRAFVDTPFDTLDRVNVDNLAIQTKTLACLIDHILNDTNRPGEVNAQRMPITEPSQFSRMGLQGGFATVKGRVVMFDLKKSFIPSTPVTGSLAVITSTNKTLMGVRGQMVQKVDDTSDDEMEQARFEFYGVPPLTAYGGRRLTQVRAYHIDEETGNIDFAPDLGQTGAKAYPIDVSITMATKQMEVITFRCESTSIYDFIDPQNLKTLTTINIYDGATNAVPRMYGMAVGHPERFQAVVEDAAVIFAQPGFTIKIVMGAGPAATRFVLINSTYERERRYEEDLKGRMVNIAPVIREGVPEGIGYMLGKHPVEGERPPELAGVVHTRSYEGTIPNIPYRVALDMWKWDDYNAEKLRKYRIINQGLDDLHNSAGALLNKAEEALARRDYAEFDALSRAAWGYEARAYPEVTKTSRDVVKGVMFYLALLLPFAFFMERLMVGSANLKNQISWVFGIFIAVFILISQIHPAFDITATPMIVLLAFIMLALSVLVIIMISGKFEQQLKEFNRQVSGVHKEDIGRMSIAAAAFSLGISNMRRRKARSILTCCTLILLTFIVLSFTSVVTGLRYNVVPAPGEPRYDGIMLRTAMWSPLEESSYRILNDEFGETHAVAPRAWFYGTQMGEQTFLSITRGDKKFDCRAVLGLTPNEREITGADASLVAGRWFRPSDVYAAILTRETADNLGLSGEDVDAGRATFKYAGMDYALIGLVENDDFKAIKDLDQEPLTPVDFILMQRQSQTGGQAQDDAEAGFREYTHLEPNTILIIPYQTLMNQGGEVRSLAINLESPTQVKSTRLELMPRLGLNLYAGEGNQTYRYSSIGSTSITGAGTIAIPILIAALIVLNTMLGAVFERQGEIHVFSSIGLAPNHVGMLFMAESMVYAVIGAMAGYVLGQGTAKIIVSLDLFQGLNLNFSSVSAVFSTLLVMGVVLLSTLYPARVASEVATPNIERTWRTPDPQGDTWVIPLPFMVTGDQATGLARFLGEWFQAYEEYSIGDFVTQDVRSTEIETERGLGYQIELTTWLAPFDLGVSQNVILRTELTDMEDVYQITLTLQRLSGDISNWKRVNRRFLNTLRKQFLIWRTLGAEDRERYMSEAQETAAAPSDD